MLIIKYTTDNIKHNEFYYKKCVLWVYFYIAYQDNDEQHNAEPDHQEPDEETDREPNAQANQTQKTPKKPKQK